jgi:hypothetical protein
VGRQHFAGHGLTAGLCRQAWPQRDHEGNGGA